MSQHTPTVAGTTADPTIKFTDLTLGKKTYKLCFDFDAVALAEEKTGMALLAGVDWRNIGVRRIAVMLYASALKAQPDVTMDEFRQYINHRNIGKIQMALADSWVENQMDEDADDISAEESADPNAQTPAPTTTGS
jgi:hypothetical protein